MVQKPEINFEAPVFVVCLECKVIRPQTTFSQCRLCFLPLRELAGPLQDLVTGVLVCAKADELVEKSSLLQEIKEELILDQVFRQAALNARNEFLSKEPVDGF